MQRPGLVDGQLEVDLRILLPEVPQDARQRRDREIVMTTKAKAGMWLKLLAPSLVDRIALDAVKDKQS